MAATWTQRRRRLCSRSLFHHHAGSTAARTYLARDRTEMQSPTFAEQTQAKSKRTKNGARRVTVGHTPYRLHGDLSLLREWRAYIAKDFAAERANSSLAFIPSLSHTLALTH